MSFSIKHGEIAFIPEILQHPDQYDGAVRVLGRCTSFDALGRRVTISSPSSSSTSLQQQQLVIDISLIPDVHFTPGSLYQFIGEVNTSNTSQMQIDGEDDDPPASITVRARVARGVDGLDLNLYEQAVKIRRNFLQTSGGGGSSLVQEKNRRAPNLGEGGGRCMVALQCKEE